MSRLALWRSPHFKDAKLTEEKYYQSSTIDSGFISGGNLTISGEIQAEEPSNYMRLDSGLDLSESFSGLNLKSRDLNDFSKTTLPPEPPVEDNDDWKEYFQQDEDGDTFLHLAIAEGYDPAVLALIRKAPHPQYLDTPNDSAQTPIHLATSTGNSRVVRWLVVAGVKPSPRNIRGDSPLHIAARMGDVNCCKALTEPVKEYERVALGLNYPKEQYQDVNLDQWNYEGQTSVHVAALGGHIEVLRHLDYCGANMNAREGRQGYTALHYSIERGDERLAHFLLSECRKLNAEAVTYGGNSAFQLGFPVPSTIAEALRSRGVPSPYSSEDEFSDSESEELYDNAMFAHNLIDASA